MTRFVQRELLAVIDDRTTIICLEAAGQVVGADEPFFTLVGDFYDPPFHEHCRSIVVPYVEGLLDPMLANRAKGELLKRPVKTRRPNRLPPAARQGVLAKVRGTGHFVKRQVKRAKPPWRRRR